MRVFGRLADGRIVNLYTIQNESGMRAEITDFGARIVRLFVTGRNESQTDVILGFETLGEYAADTSYQGAVVGRVCNRISGANFELNGATYRLAKNENDSTLHGGNVGFDKRLFEAEQISDSIVSMCYVSPDGEEGFPGKLELRVTYTVTDENGLRIDYQAQTDKDTLCNITNHAYFNLSGAGSQSVMDHMISIDADHYNSVNDEYIPTDVASVEGTVMDLRLPKAVCEAFSDAGLPKSPLVLGYDHNFILNSGSPAATVLSPRTGIEMHVFTDSPSMQLYMGNHLDNLPGKNGAVYGKHSALCLEAQIHPDSIHHPEWPSCILRAGSVFTASTEYRFSRKQILKGEL